MNFKAFKQEAFRKLLNKKLLESFKKFNIFNFFSIFSLIKNLNSLTSHIQVTIESHSRNISDQNEIIESMQAELKAFCSQLTDCRNSLDNFQCKYDDADFIEELFSHFHERIALEFKDHLTSTKDEIENLKAEQFDEQAKLTGEMSALKALICEQLKTYERDLVKCLMEIQQMLNTKFNKCDVVEFEKFLTDELSKLNEKIENIECKRAIAAGCTKNIFKDINCITCGDKVIQIDDITPQMLIKRDKESLHEVKLLKLSEKLPM